MPESTEPTGTSNEIWRDVVLPIFEFYSRPTLSAEGRGKRGDPLTDTEREALTDGASKLVAESEVLLRSLRENATVTFVKPERDTQTGLYPPPSVALFGEVLAAAGILKTAPAPTREEVQLATLEAEIERERLALERQRMSIIESQVRAGARSIVDPGPVEPRPLTVSTSRVAPPTGGTTAARALMGAASTAMVGRGGFEPAEIDPDALPDPGGQGAGIDPGDTSNLLNEIIDCLRVALCDFILCFLDIMCVNGKFRWDAFSEANSEATLLQLQDCVGVFICTALRCFVDVLCPPTQPTLHVSQEPCDLAVEEL